MHARDGDHLICPFECDQCIFVKLKGRLPCMRLEQDKLLNGCIRRMILDSFWSRESRTVATNRRRAEQQLKWSRIVGLNGSFVHRGTMPSHDHCGYEIAIQILLKSRQPGRHSKSYTQYDTIRMYRSTFSNFIKSSVQGNNTNQAFGDFNGNYTRLVDDDCASIFFKKFMEGVKRRMGSIWKPNAAMSIELLLNLIELVEDKILTSSDSTEIHDWIVFSAYVTVSYVISLRGPEGRLLDLGGLKRHWNRNENYVVIPLYGRRKGEHQDRCHLLPSTPITGSGIKVFDNLKRLMEEKAKYQLHSGPAISDTRG